MKTSTSTNLTNGLLGLVALAAVTSVGLRVREAFIVPTPDGTVTPKTVSDWRTYGQAGERLGPANAAVTIVVFSDFQCPFCREAAKDLDAVEAAHPRDVAVVFRHFPLGMHPYARAAARAAQCAAHQHAFVRMYDRLFQLQDSIGIKPWSDFALESGIADQKAFGSCMRDDSNDAALRIDSIAGVRLGVRGTPTLLINDLRFSGSPGKDSLNHYVNKALGVAGSA